MPPCVNVSRPLPASRCSSLQVSWRARNGRRKHCGHRPTNSFFRRSTPQERRFTLCKADGAQFAWNLKGVDAQLTDKDGKPFGKHYSGPTWEANDSSRITGKAAANYPSPDKDAIPWLLLSVASHSGEGALTKVTSIQRLNTRGGKAPAGGCDKAHVDQEVRIPYTADYVFFAAK